ncbi:thioredoxin family protein [Flavobacterium sp.]|uniref:thioredoxin family protein n=1 Tax=Flavobacterium sp. TaxID=239 RepID=UPI0035287D13
MKKLAIIIMLTFFGLTTQAQELKWHTDISEATKIALDENKPLFLFFTGSDWCGWCIKLQKEVFQKPEFAKWATENVVLVELDYPKRKQLPTELQQQNAQMQQMFQVTGFPTIWFVKPVKQEGKKVNLDELGKTGYVPGGPEAWIKVADAILKKQ